MDDDDDDDLPSLTLKHNEIAPFDDDELLALDDRESPVLTDNELPSVEDDLVSNLEQRDCDDSISIIGSSVPEKRNSQIKIQNCRKLVRVRINK